jgi:hypothetical protein
MATGTLRLYHAFVALVVPLSLVAREGTRTFLVDWSPLIAFWLGYDRLRLVQRFLLSRVAAEWPYHLEKAAFSWLGGGEVPAHAWRTWLATHSASPFIAALSVAAQCVYLSHLFVLPLLLMILWMNGRANPDSRREFLAYVRAFTVLHVLGLTLYLSLPVAPPWWVSLHGMAAPTPELLAQSNLRDAIEGVISQRLISNASQWFAAVPSLHGAYPVLLLMLARRRRSNLAVAAFGIYGIAVWLATIALNLHYVIDLIAGLVVATLSYAGAGWIDRTLQLRRPVADAGSSASG